MPDLLHILLVDDDDLDRQAARRALRSVGLPLEITEARSARETLDFFAARSSCDCVFLDYSLPDSDGLTLIRALRASGVETPIVMLTAYGDENVAVEVMKAGASDYISKSQLTPETLGQSLRAALRVREAEAAAQAAGAALSQSEERYRSLVDATAQIVWTNTPAGEMRGPQPGWSAFTGQSEREYAGFGWAQAVHPDDAQPTIDAWNASVRSRTAFVFEHRVRRHDGQWRTFAIRAVPILEDDGAVREWVGIHSDITEHKNAETRLRFLADVSAILAGSLNYEETLPRVAQLAVETMADWCIVELAQPDGTLRRVEVAHADPSEGESFRQVRRFSPDGNPAHPTAQAFQSGVSVLWTEVTPAMLESSAQTAEHLQIMRDIGTKSLMAVPMIARGETLGALTFGLTRAGRRYAQSDLEVAEEMARRTAQAIDNARLFQETTVRAERESLINDIGRALRGSLDESEILSLATEKVGRALRADHCTFARLNAERRVLVLAQEQYHALGFGPVSRNWSLADIPAEWLTLLRAGQCVSVSDFPASPFTQNRAFLACPVFVRGVWIGFVSVSQTDRPRVWTDGEIALLTAVGDLLAPALENARLYAREHRVADMLSTALIPDLPEMLADLELAKVYKAGLDEARVGGDFYDAFALADGRVGLVMADVSGKGLNAAVQTATAKYSLRAFATEAATPSLTLTRLNRTLCNEAAGLGEHFVTLFYGVYDPRSGRLAYASAGHETQIIKRRDGTTTELAATGPILGIAEIQYEQAEQQLLTGDALILFTDGLTEARQKKTRVLLDLPRVVEAVANLDSGLTASELVASLKLLAHDWSGGNPADDLALLVARRTGDAALPASSGATRIAEEDELLFAFVFPSRSDYAADIRQAVAHWMSAMTFERAAIEDFQTAVTEAVTNAVRHGSPGGSLDQFRASGFRAAGDVFVVEIADNGPGLTPSLLAPLMPPPDAAGGRGLPLMETLADSIEHIASPNGHRVRLVKRLHGNAV